jgi:drug/metabolite transporter (DMT)-like permease
MPSSSGKAPSIWWWAFGYFAAYAPYSALTNALTVIGIGGEKVGGVELLPVTVLATVVTAMAFLAVTGWWRYAVHAGERIPRPTLPTALSGLCASGIIATTTYAYTFHGLVLVSLLMRGGVLILAPAIDLLSGRRIRWYSAAALVLALAALSLPLFGGGLGPDIPFACGLDVAIYLMCYFVRLQLMTRRAKSPDPDANLRYFVEEQLVSSPALLLILVVWAFALPGAFAGSLHGGFVDFWAKPVWLCAIALGVGVLSQGTGIFGGLILLDRSENTFSVPVNRASSVIAVLIGSLALAALTDAHAPSSTEIEGACLMIVAIVLLSVGSILDKKRSR